MQLPEFLAVRGVDPHHLERYLLPGEEPALIIRRHPALLLRYLAETLGGLILAGVLSATVPQGVVLTVIWCGWLVLVGRLAFKVFEWSDEFFTVTSVRVMLVHGIIVRRVDMMPITKITDLTLDRSFLGRLLGYGTIVLESAGQDQALNRVHHCADPETVYLEISAAAFGLGD